MSAIGSEVSESARYVLGRAVYCCLFVLAGGEYLGGSAAWAGNNPTNLGGVTVTAPPLSPPTDVGRVTVTAPPRIDRLSFRNLGLDYGGWGGGGDTGSMNYWEPYPLPDENIANRNSSLGGGCAGNPVVISTGNKVEFETDFQTISGDDLGLERVYNHYWSGQGAFGRNWITNHDYQVTFEDYEAGACIINIGLPGCDPRRAHTIIAWRPDGRRLRYTRGGDGIYRSADAPTKTYMEFNANGQLVYYAEDEGVETYQDTLLGVAAVESRTSSTGDTWTYEYWSTFLTRVSHNSGRFIEFLRDSNTLQVYAVRDPAGNLHNYTYKTLANNGSILASHSQPASGLSVVYHYEDPSFPTALTGKSINGQRYSTFGYDNTARVGSSEHAGGVERFIFSYSFSDGEWCDDSGCYSSGITNATTQVTNPLGKIATYNYENGRQVSIVGEPSAHCPTSSALTTYDPNNRVDRTTDAKGIVTDQDYDANGRLIKTTQALGTPEERSTTLVWEPARDRLLSSTLWKGTIPIARTERAYTLDNRIASIRQVNLTGTGISGQAYLTTYAYTKHPNGVLATVTVDGPLPGSADAGIARFNSYGDLIAEENGLGHVVTYSGHNGLGLPGRRVGANGDVTDYIYDALGRVTKIRSYPNGVAADITYTYTAAQLASVQTPDGQTRTREYDAAWRVIRESELEPTGTYAVTRYIYNNASLVTSVVTERTGEPDAPPVPPAPAAPPISTTSASGSSGSHTITWGAIGNADYYVLEESIDGGTWTQVYSGSDLSWSAAGRIPGTYRYRIKACAANGGCSVDPSIVTIMVTPNIIPILYELLLD